MIEQATYQDTGIPWMKKIPSNWKVGRVKSYFDFSAIEAGENYEAFRVLSLSVIGEGVIVRDMDSGKGKYSLSMDKYIVVQPNSIVLCLFDMDVTPRIVGYCKDEGIITGAYTNVIPKPSIHSKFYYYFFLRQDENKSLKAQGTGVRTTLTNNQFGAFKIPIPPLNEQIAIANYLDSQSKKIKTFIKKKERFIELLKEQKQSVIDKILINKGRKVKIKYCVSKIGGGVTPKGGATVYKNSGIMFLRSQNIYNDGLSIENVAFITEEVHSTMKGSQVKKNDVLINVTGASIGRCYTYLLDDEANVNQHVTIIRPDLSILIPEFLMLQLQSDRIQHQINMIEGASREGLTKGDISNYYLYLPSKQEQTQIVSHIKTETAKIDQAISKAEREIELLKEYKEAMIAEAVLGKLNLPAGKAGVSQHTKLEMKN